MTPSSPGPRGREPAGPGARSGAARRPRNEWGTVFAGPLVWAGFGWVADRWLGTGPWLTVVGVMVGFAGGLYLMWHHSVRASAKPDEHGMQGDRKA
jgi:hypothetical protein